MKKILLASLIMGTLFSCSNDDNDGDLNNTENSILPVKIVTTTDSGDYNSISTISYDGNKIKEISITYSGVENYSEKSVYQYNGDLITKITNLNKNGIEDMIKEYTYQNGKVSTLVTTEWYEKGTANEQKYVSNSKFEWVTDNHLKIVITYNNSAYIGTEEYFYTNGNLTSYNRENNEHTTTYDNKENPFRNITGIKLISFDEESTSSKNNPLKSEHKYNTTFQSNTVYTYEYKSNNFPSKMTSVYTSSSNQNQTETTEYTYNK